MNNLLVYRPIPGEQFKKMAQMARITQMLKRGFLIGVISVISGSDIF
ncbi:MAG: hypothetical protein NT166_09245 [Candidatus Aminicenantes bacterium]|nr:hypothetical protein [Candidatus Aminicenantes bacterium]